jgi:hypothetical protein
MSMNSKKKDQRPIVCGTDFSAPAFEGMLQSNDNWREISQPEIMGAGLAPADDREAALFQPLAPGAYSVIVAGEGSTTGVGPVEAYCLR